MTDAWHQTEWPCAELRVEHDHSFRMTALTVAGRTLVIVIQGPAADFAKFLPIANGLVASLRFTNS